MEKENKKDSEDEEIIEIHEEPEQHKLRVLLELGRDLSVEFNESNNQGTFYFED